MFFSDATKNVNKPSEFEMKEDGTIVVRLPKTAEDEDAD